jgi:uncharacterized protein (TIGR03000 family)
VSYSACYGGCYGGGASYAPTYSESAPVISEGATGRAPSQSSQKTYVKGQLPKANKMTVKVTNSAEAGPVSLTVTLPADAKLLVDGRPTATTGARRVFRTPSLTPGQKYEYVLKASVVRNGKTVSWSKRVQFQAGQDVAVTLRVPNDKTVASR